MTDPRKGRLLVIRRYETEFQVLLALADALMALAVIICLSILRYGRTWADVWAAQVTEHLVPLLLAYLTAWVLLLFVHGMYRPRVHWTLRREVVGVVRATMVLALATFGVLFFLRLPDVSRGLLLVLFPSQALVTVASRAGLRAALHALRRGGRNLRFMVVVGDGEAARRFAASLESQTDLGLMVVGFLSEQDVARSSRWPRLGGIDELPGVLTTRVVDEVAICLPFDQWQRVQVLAAVAGEAGKIVRIPLELTPTAVGKGYVEELDGMPVLSLITSPDRGIELFAKRALDVAASVIGIIVLSPILIGAAAAILLLEGRPILFRQKRAGLQGRSFSIVKFRTMTRDADDQRNALRAFNEVKGTASFKMTNDPRITRLGRVLRRTSIDELPQLWNVLRGEMSLVGPRPHPFDDVAGYDAWHHRRLSMKPGITGLWQIGARQDDDFDRWVEKDLEYIDRWNLWLDLRVLLATVPALLRVEGR